MICEEIMCDANNLYKAYMASVRNSKWKTSSQQFMLDYLSYIFSLQDDLRNRTLQNGKVKEFMLSERGHVRLIASLPTRDRIVRHVLCDDILLPEIEKRIIYDNGASIKGRGMAHQRKRFEVHLRKYYKQYGREGWILFGDFSKFYDNIIHDIAKKQLLALYDGDEYLKWLLDLIFSGFQSDVSYMSDAEYEECLCSLFDRLKHHDISKELLTGERRMEKSMNIGDQLSQIIGIYYPNRIDTYVKYVRQQKFYGRYMDDWYIINPDREVLNDILQHIYILAEELGIHINQKKTRIVKVSSTFKYLQVKYNFTSTGKIVKRINPKRVTTMRRKLKKLAVQVDAGDNTYENVESMFRSWMGSFYKLMSRQQRNNLLQLYEDLFDKSIRIENKKMVITDRKTQ